jgi:hypothetical protein
MAKKTAPSYYKELLDYPPILGRPIHKSEGPWIERAGKTFILLLKGMFYSPWADLIKSLKHDSTSEAALQITAVVVATIVNVVLFVLAPEALPEAAGVELGTFEGLVFGMGANAAIDYGMTKTGKFGEDYEASAGVANSVVMGTAGGMGFVQMITGEAAGASAEDLVTSLDKQSDLQILGIDEESNPTVARINEEYDKKVAEYKSKGWPAEATDDDALLQQFKDAKERLIDRITGKETRQESVSADIDNGSSSEYAEPTDTGTSNADNKRTDSTDNNPTAPETPPAEEIKREEDSKKAETLEGKEPTHTGTSNADNTDSTDNKPTTSEKPPAEEIKGEEDPRKAETSEEGKSSDAVDVVDKSTGEEEDRNWKQFQQIAFRGLQGADLAAAISNYIKHWSSPTTSSDDSN